MLGKSLARYLEKGDILCLFGGLGSGKTVFSKGIAGGLGIPAEKIISPTFVLLRQYPRARIPLYHFDFYRLSDERDIAALGYQEYLYGEGVSIVEWADRLASLLPEEYLKIELSVIEGNHRALQLSACGGRYEGLLERLRSRIRAGRLHA